MNNPQAVYGSIGTYLIQLTASNIYGCTDSLSQSIRIYSAPFDEISISPFNGCQPLTVNFNHIYEAIIHYWDFGDGTYSTLQNPTHTYQMYGTFPIGLKIQGVGGCQDSIKLTDSIHVFPKPVVDFTYQFTSPDPNTGEVQFINNTILGDYFNWEFGDGESSLLFEPSHRYRFPGIYDIELTSTNSYGCSDIQTKQIEIEDMYGLFIPNAFAPDNPNSGVNIFKPVGVGIQIFQLQVFDTWGNIIWESTALENGRPIEYWDGTFKGNPAPSDVYVWKAFAVFMNGTPWTGMKDDKGTLQVTGPLLLIR